MVSICHRGFPVSMDHRGAVMSRGGFLVFLACHHEMAFGFAVMFLVCHHEMAFRV